MERYLFLPLISLLFLAGFTGCQEEQIKPTLACSPVGPDEGAAHPKDLVFRDILSKYTRLGLPGISLLIRDKDGRWVGSAGMADIERGIAMQPCHVSKAASITKIFIGTLVMKLVEDGVLDLDTPISEYLPYKYLSKVENAGSVTLRQLLNHTSGIYDVIESNAFYLKVFNDPLHFWEEDELLHFAYNQPAVFSPGTDVDYSNTNLLLAAMVIESATGESHGKLLRERVILPLGLSNTFYHWHDALPPFTAQGYYDLYNNGTLINMSEFNTGSGNGYGGLYSNVYDLQVFIESLLRDKTLLTGEGLKEMTRITSESVSTNEAFGVSIRKDFLDRAEGEYGLGHRGRDLAYSADLYYFPNQDVTMAYLVNYGTDADSGLKQVFTDFRKELVDALMSK